VDVSGFNSSVYYVITDRPGQGELVVRVPVTGNETVLDAMAQIYGLPATASKKRIWLSRPVPADAGCEQIPADRLGGDHAARPDRDELPDPPPATGSMSRPSRS